MPLGNPTKLVSVDDSSPLVTYSGAWSLVSKAQAHNSTLHSTTEPGASASFWFRGSSITIALTLQACANNTASNRSGTQLQFYVSGIDDGATPTYACSMKGTVDDYNTYDMAIPGDPTVLREVRVTNVGLDTRFPLMLDRFRYMPPDEGYPSSITTSEPTAATSTQTTASSAIPVGGTNRLTYIIIGLCAGLVIVLSIGGFIFYHLRSRARSRRTARFSQEKPTNPFDDAHGYPAPLPSSPSSSSYALPITTQAQSFQGNTRALSPSLLLLVKSLTYSFRSRSPNSLFDITDSRASTPSQHCVLGKKMDFDRCSCSDSTEDVFRHKYRASSATGSVVSSRTSLGTSAVPKYDSMSHAAHASLRVQVASDPFADGPPAYRGSDDI